MADENKAGITENGAHPEPKERTNEHPEERSHEQNRDAVKISMVRASVGLKRDEMLRIAKPDPEAHVPNPGDFLASLNDDEDVQIENFLPRSEAVVQSVSNKINTLSDGLYDLDRDDPNRSARIEEIRVLTEQIKTIRAKQQSIITPQIKRVAEEITSEYMVLFNELKDSMNTDVKQVYAEKTLIPRIKRETMQYGFADVEGDFFIASVRDLLAQRLPSDEAMGYVKHFVDSSYYNLRDDVAHLTDESAENVVRRVIGLSASADLQVIYDAYKKFFPGVGDEMAFSLVFNSSIEQAHGTDGYMPKVPLAKEITDALSGYDSKYIKMEQMLFWDAAKQTPLVKHGFEDVIDAHDQKICALVQDSAWHDSEGMSVDLLKFYPNPQTIAQLMLLSTARRGGFGTTHANWALTELAKGSEWATQVDEAIAAYPSLEATRDVLLGWKFSEQWVNPDLEGKTDPFVAAMYKDSSSQAVKEVALDAMSNETMITIMHDEGKLTASNTEVFRQVQAKIEAIEESNRQRIEADETDVEEFSAYYFMQEVNKKLKARALSQSEYRSDGIDRDIDRFVELGNQFLANSENEAKRNFLISQEVVGAVMANNIKPEIFSELYDNGKGLLGEKFIETRKFLYQHAGTLLREPGDIRFYNGLIGEHGQRAIELIKGYSECLDQQVMRPEERDIIVDFTREFRVVSPDIIRGYKTAKEAGNEAMYIAKLRDLVQRIGSTSEITEAEHASPEYMSLLKHVFPNNSDNWTSYENNESCSDRTGDLEAFRIRPVYEIDLLSQSEVTIKEDETFDETILERVQAPIYKVADKMRELDYDSERLLAAFNAEVSGAFDTVLANGGLENMDLSAVRSEEEKLFLVMTDSIYGSKALSGTDIQNLLLTYQFAKFEDIRSYIAGTSDRVSRAGNHDYALLCEVDNFYSDRIKEVNRHIVQTAYENPAIAAKMPEYFDQLATEVSSSERADMINRLRIDSLGMSDQFVKRMGSVLKKKNGRDYTPEQVKEIIRRYESYTGGLQDATTTATNRQTREFYGQLRSQRERSLAALNALTGEDYDPKDVFLGEIDFQSVLDTEANIRSGNYDEEQFGSYTVQRFIDIFDKERSNIQQELGKFVSSQGKTREVIKGYISKNKTSAHARMVGGVCVSGDNPYKNPDVNMWDMPNYFQMVLVEPETSQCQGALLLHHFVEGGKKILTASFNPSSTYLYSVDEAALFKGLLGSLTEFATDNDFDSIVVSQSHAIRTNRTGGAFERAMDEKIREKNKKLSFTNIYQFSYEPHYSLLDMDVVWEKEAAQSSQ